MEKLTSNSHEEFLTFSQEYATYTENHSDFQAERNMRFLNAAITNPLYECFIKRGKEAKIQAFALFRTDTAFPTEGKIMIVYASPQYYSKLQRVDKEKEIFQFALAILKEKVDLIGANTFGYSQELNQFILGSGFKILERYTLEITKEEIVALPNLQLPKGFNLISLDMKYVEEMIPVIYQYNKGSIDNKLFGFFHNLSNVHSFLNELQLNRWGKFDSKNSKILVSHNNSTQSFQGVCFFTSFGEERAYIPDLGVIQEIRGKSVGKSMFSFR